VENDREVAMSATDIANGLGQTAGSPRRAANLLRRCFDAFCARRIREALRATLENLSDRELKDIGVTRGEIDYLIRAAPSIDPRDF
jgi:uncharacterized protein YjiS (DUF1127 family)